MTSTEKAIVKRLEYLSKMLSKYSNAWWDSMHKKGEPSARMDSWSMEYDDLIHDHYEVFKKWCIEKDYCPTHNASDCLA